MFIRFDSTEERRNCGGSSFMEMQFCRLPLGTPLEKVVEIDCISHWQNGSLYIRDESEFVKEYGDIFVCGIYNNLHAGPVDVCGINYYSPEVLDRMVERIAEKKPKGHEVLLEWLDTSDGHNGIYVLGI